MAQIEWDPKVGPASLIGLIGFAATLISLGVIWGSATTKLDAAAAAATDAKTVATDAKNTAGQQESRIGKIETAVGFIVPTINRIEAKLDRGAANLMHPWPSSPIAPQQSPD